MMHWVITATIDPEKLTGTVSGRFGASVMFVAYDRFLRQWNWIYPGGQERINEPPLIFVDEDWARDARDFSRKPRVEKSLAIRKKKAQQLLLF